MKLLTKLLTVMVSSLVITFFTCFAHATVETETVKMLSATGKVLDTALSGDGKYFYVLTAKGVVEIFPLNGGSKEEISINGKADKIAVSESGDNLFLTDSQAGATQQVSVSFVQSFELEGSPIKGLENAPVTIVLFSDFQ